MTYIISTSCMVATLLRTELNRHCLPISVYTFYFIFQRTFLYSEPGSNRHSRNGNWILSPTRLPIPPPEHIVNQTNECVKILLNMTTLLRRLLCGLIESDVVYYHTLPSIHRIPTSLQYHNLLMDRTTQYQYSVQL